eukprot:SAG31_NODE_8185_length_1501_cov_1.433666_2_plen_69_part_00
MAYSYASRTRSVRETPSAKRCNFATSSASTAAFEYGALHSTQRHCGPPASTGADTSLPDPSSASIIDA